MVTFTDNRDPYELLLHTLKKLFMDRATFRRAWSLVSTMMWSVMKSGPSMRQKVIRAPSFFGLPAEEGKDVAECDSLIRLNGRIRTF